MFNYITLSWNADAVNPLTSSLKSCIEKDDSTTTTSWLLKSILQPYGTYELDHLNTGNNCSDFKCKNSAKADLDNLKWESIVGCHINDEWDVSKERNMAYALRNHAHIKQMVQELMEWYLQTSVGLLVI